MSCGNVKNPPGFWCTRVGAQKHTPRNDPRRRFGSKTGRVFGVSGCGNMKPVKFCTYPCRGVLHTPRKTPRRGFAPKTGRVLGISLLGKVKSGAFLVYPCAEIWNPPNFARIRVGAYCIRPETILAEGLRLKSGRFWAYPYWEI